MKKDNKELSNDSYERKRKKETEREFSDFPVSSL